MSENPLSGYFRRPSIFINLPSKGNFYPDGALEMPVNNEIPVYPMTAVDEITYRTPDALFNGSAIASVIGSCIPNIKDPWQVPSIDLDTILSAIRIASYGHTLEIDTTCPKCEEEANYGLDLRTVLDQLKTPDYSKSVIIGDLELFFKPLTFKDVNENNIIQFEEQKLISVLKDADISEEEKLKLLSNAFSKVTELTITSIVQSIRYIQTPDATVQDPVHINEFLHQCERSIFENIKKTVIDLRDITELKPLDITCHSCQHEYQQPFTLDMTNFFV
jgi:hypothetical protein